jgi:triosephosphate isomerase
VRRPLIAGNWKMNLLRAEARQLTRGVVAGAGRVPRDRDLLLLPPFTLLDAVGGELGSSGVRLGAQDLHWESAGAYTSGVSGPMLRDLGCEFVLVGHSERRTHFGDTGAALHRKLRAALSAGLRPIYCVGESLEEREAGRTWVVLRTQCDEVLRGLAPQAMAGLTLAYEPVWAIGTGRTATPEVAQEAHAFLRGSIAREWGDSVASEVRLLYGGSVTPESAAGLLDRPDIDGALVGGASLRAESFLGIAGAGASA